MVKKKKVSLALATSLLAGCASVSRYSNDDILVVSTNKGLNIIEDINGFWGTTIYNSKTEKTRKQLYSMGITDVKEYKLRFNKLMTYWREYFKTNKFQNIKDNWKNSSLEDRKKALNKINSDFIFDFPVLKENNVQSKIKFLGKDSKLAGQFENNFFRAINKHICINEDILKTNDFSGPLSVLAHELTHALDYSKIAFNGVKSNYDRLLIANSGFMDRGYDKIIEESLKHKDSSFRKAYQRCPAELLSQNIELAVLINSSSCLGVEDKFFIDDIDSALHLNCNREKRKELGKLGMKEIKFALKDEIITSNEVKSIVAKRKPKSETTNSLN